MAELREITEETQRRFFEEAHEHADRAIAGCGEIVRSYRIAGTIVRLHFAGPVMESRITPALEHLRAGDDGPADLDVRLWDTASTGVGMTPPPCPQRYFTDRGNVWGFESERYRFGYQYGEFSVSLFDAGSGNALFWVEDAGRLPFWTTAAPLRGMLSWWLAHNGMQLVHGAVVGTDAGAVLLPGRGGSGKSSTALACLDAGLAYVGDDYVGVALDPEPRAYCLYRTAKLEPAQLERVERFRALAPDAEVGREGGYEKAVLFLDGELGERVRSELPLTAILVPHITGKPETRLAPIEALAVERAAAMTTLSQLPHSGQSTVVFITRLTRSVPRAGLLLGTDFERIPAVVADCARGSAEFRAVACSGQDLQDPQEPQDPQVSISTHEGHSARDLPLVSVVIPVHDGADFLRGAVASVMAQGYPRIEILIVNDASTDATREVVASFEVDHRYFEFETNEGPAEARNRGIREAAADLVAFLDVDDRWPAGCLEAMVRRLIDDESIDVVCGRSRVLELDPASGEYHDHDDARSTFPFYIGAGVYRRRAFLRNGLFDRTFRFGEDSDWYLRAFEEGLNCVKLDDVTLFVRRHDRNMTRGKTNLEMNQARVFKARLDRKRGRGEGSV